MSKKNKKKRINKHLYILAVKNGRGEVAKLIPSHDYNGLQLAGMELAKKSRGDWAIYRLFRPGIEIDGGILTAPWKEVKNAKRR